MAKKKIAAKSTNQVGGKKRKQKNPTQKPAMQRIKVMGPTGKLHLEWREW